MTRLCSGLQLQVGEAAALTLDCHCVPEPPNQPEQYKTLMLSVALARSCGGVREANKAFVERWKAHPPKEARRQPEASYSLKQDLGTRHL